ncbi:MAG: RAD55 family ATPase [Euryarchaeota archaeon]|nr:RAD55 family ATPase [Euryarchaeota archaeon]
MLAKTGILELDDCLNGGLPFSKLILFVVDPLASTDDIFCSIVHEGLKAKQPVIHITTNITPTALREKMLSFGIDAKSFEAKKLLFVVDAITPEAGLGEFVTEKYPAKASDPNDIHRMLREAWIDAGRPQNFRLILNSLSSLFIFGQKTHVVNFIKHISAGVNTYNELALFIYYGKLTDEIVSSIQEYFHGIIYITEEELRRRKINIVKLPGVEVKDRIVKVGPAKA